MQCCMGCNGLREESSSPFLASAPSGKEGAGWCLQGAFEKQPWEQGLSQWGWEHIVLNFLSHQCPDSACKQDLLAYLQRIALYCHQLNICSKVKAEVQNLGGELVVSGVSVAMRSGG